jgi:TolB-like protein
MRNLLALGLLCLGALPGQSRAQVADRPRQKVAVFDLKASGLDDSARTSLMAVLTKAVAATPWLDVVSRDEIATMLDAEAQKQLVGCDDTGCLAEIAGALDVDLLVAGSVTRLGEGLVVTLQLINQRFANVMNRVALSWNGPADRLPEVLEAAAQLLLLEPADRPPVRVQVIEAPADTEVFLDEVERGVVDAQGALDLADVGVGLHVLRLVAPGHQMRQIPFVARVGKNVRVNGALEPLPFYATWWFWTGAAVLGAGVIVAGAVVAVVLLADNTGSVRISADPATAQEAP